MTTHEVVRNLLIDLARVGWWGSVGNLLIWQDNRRRNKHASFLIPCPSLLILLAGPWVLGWWTPPMALFDVSLVAKAAGLARKHPFIRPAHPPSRPIQTPGPPQDKVRKGAKKTPSLAKILCEMTGTLIFMGATWYGIGCLADYHASLPDWLT
jgi:hypothetical protein